MFSFPLEKMVGGIFYEHGHRLIASTVGFLTIILAVWTWRVEPRRWVRRLGVAALGAVILQGLLGGITVLLLLPAPVSIGHAGLAQIFFCLTISLALFTSPGWRSRRRPVDDPTLRRVAVATTVLIYCQIHPRRDDEAYEARDGDSGLSAGVRASGAAGLERRSRDPLRAPRRRAARDDRDPRDRWARLVPSPRRAASWCGRRRCSSCFVLAQVTLGAFVVWSGLQPVVNTAHVVNGALVLATSLVLTLRSFRIALRDLPQPTPPSRARRAGQPAVARELDRWEHAHT